MLITPISGGLLFSYIYSLRRASSEFDDLAKMFYNKQVAENTTKKDNLEQAEKTDHLSDDIKEAEKMDMTLIFQELQRQNSDIAGWMSISGTNINYPIMHTPNNPEYYLHRNFEIEPRSDNILIHDHNMKDGSMFAQLLAYKDKEFLKQHATIDLYTLSKKQTYDIMAVFPADVYNDNNAKFNYHTFVNAENQEQFSSYMTSVKKTSLFDTGIEAQYGDDLLTLSTCAYHTTHGRFVVIAKGRN